MTAPDPPPSAATPGGNPSVIERLGIRTERYGAQSGDGDPETHVSAQVTRSGARITVTIPQAHELIDQLAWLLGRPDLITAHRITPQRRTQPGGTK